MSEMHLKQPQFTCSVCVPFTKNKKRIQKFNETGDSRYIYRNDLDTACFQHDIAYGDFKDLARRTTAVLSIILVLKQQFVKYSSIEYN